MHLGINNGAFVGLQQSLCLTLAFVVGGEAAAHNAHLKRGLAARQEALHLIF